MGNAPPPPGCNVPLTRPEAIEVDNETMAEVIAAAQRKGGGPKPAFRFKNVGKYKTSDGHALGGDPFVLVMIMAQKAGSKALLDWVLVMLFNGHMKDLPSIAEELITVAFSKMRWAAHPDKCSPKLRTDCFTTGAAAKSM